MYPPSIQLLLRTLYNSFPVKMKIQNCFSKVSEQIMATSEVNQADIGKWFGNFKHNKFENHEHIFLYFLTFSTIWYF